MKIVNVESRDIHITTDLSITQMRYLKMFLDHAEVSYDGEKEPEMARASEYVTNFLYPLLREFLNNYDNQG